MDSRTYTLLWHDGISEIEILITLRPYYFQNMAHLEIQNVFPRVRALRHECGREKLNERSVSHR